MSATAKGRGEALAAHRRFLDRYYGVSRHFYDVTRRYYLLGRDRLLDELAGEPWQRLVEVGPGTGRNLRRLHARRPGARLGGIDASEAMLEHARPRCRFATLARGFAEEADYAAVVGGPPDRILFSYCLSMVQEPWRALAWARRQLAPGGSIAIVDFADLGGLPPLVGGGLRRWIGAFHVRPLDLGRLRAEGAALHLGPGRYYVIARLQG